MDWKLNVIIGVSVLTLVASAIGALEQIAKFLSWAARPVLRKRYIGKGTWPLKLTIRSTILGGTDSAPMLIVMLLIEPRKAVILGQCNIVHGSSKFTPYAPLDIHDFQKWIVGDYLEMPRTYRLSFPAPRVEQGSEVRVEVESEGYECVSNSVIIP